MTPQEHYEAAERLLKNADGNNGALRRDQVNLLAAAQVHATLATVHEPVTVVDFA